MPVPDITHLQFLIIEILGGLDRPGREIRKKLAAEKVNKSGPAFYQLMARMEEAKLVKGEYRKIDIDGQAVQERWYKVTGAGLKARERTRDFYAERAAFGVKGGLANAN